MRSPAGTSSSAGKGGGSSPFWHYGIWALAIAILGLYWLFSLNPHRPELTYTAFKQAVRAGHVVSVVFDGQQIKGRFDQPRVIGAGGSAGVGSGSAGAGGGSAGAGGGSETQGSSSGTAPPSSASPESGGPSKSATFTTTRPPVRDPELMPLLKQNGVEIAAVATGTSWWTEILIGIAPWLLLIGLFYYGSSRLRQMAPGGGGGPFGFGKSKAKRFERNESRVTFGDVAGLEHAKRDLEQIIAYLKDPAHYKQLGAKIPKGVLLMGPPGTGKTLLARASAGEAGVPFFSISGSEFIEMFVGVGASRVRDMFESAKKEAPAIIFIDEIDSVGRARGTGLGGGHDEREQTLNQILGEMDGFTPHEAVVVMAATNRPDVLDPALLRPGRFDRKITLELPEKDARREILRIHARAVPRADDVDMGRIAALTVGFSAADLENLVNEAALSAGSRGQKRVEMADFLRARDKVVLGTERRIVLQGEEKKIIAYHESGHAIAAGMLPHADPPQKVTIVPRGRALGATEQLPLEERHNLQESYLRDRLGVALAGRAAERIVFGETSSGAEQDLKQATMIARRMMTQWGMSKVLGPVAFRHGEEHVFLGREIGQPRDFSEHTAEIIDEELRKLLQAVSEEIETLLQAHRGTLDRLAERLLDAETVERDELCRILESPEPTATTARRAQSAGAA